MDNTLGVENLKIVTVDAVIVAKDFVDAAKDGIQVTDAIVVFKDLPKIQEIASKAKQAYAELKDLTPDESQEVVDHVNDNLQGDTVTLTKIRKSLQLVARAHRVTAEAVDLVQDARDLFE